MRPDAMKTRLFPDGGDPEETKSVLKQAGFLDGQTTIRMQHLYSNEFLQQRG